MRMVKKVVGVGKDSLMVIIDKPVVKWLKLEAGDDVVVDVVKKVRRKKVKLHQS